MRTSSERASDFRGVSHLPFYAMEPAADSEGCSSDSDSFVALAASAAGERQLRSAQPSANSGATASGHMPDVAAACLERPCSASCSTPGSCPLSPAALSNLTPVQRAILPRLVGLLDSKQDSVVITNPLCSPGPIV